MSRSRAFRRWTVAALLTGLVGIGATGCVAVPVGGYDGGYYGGGPQVVVPTPGVNFYYGPRYHGGYRHGGYYRGRYTRHWR